MAIEALGYVIIETAQPKQWDHFMTEVVGVMRAEGPADGGLHYRIDDRPFRFRIVDGGQERLLAAAYRLDSRGSLDNLAAKLANAGHEVVHGAADAASIRGVDAYFSVTDPAGNGLEFYCGDSVDHVPFVSPQGVEGFVTGGMGLGHAVFAAPDFDTSHAFYRDLIGFHDTDLPHFKFSPDPADPGMRFAFMHADNGRHHSVAIGESPNPPSGCVHLMLEMTKLDDVKACNARMAKHGVPESATLGLHTNDEMTSFYMQTPSGFDLEVGCDGLIIDPASWQTTAHKTISEWGHEWAWQKAMAEAAAQEASATEAAK